jgi:hypothetical protein
LEERREWTIRRTRSVGAHWSRSDKTRKRLPVELRSTDGAPTLDFTFSAVRRLDGQLCYIVPVKSYLRLKTGREAAEVELQQWRSKRRTAEKEKRRKRRDLRKRAALGAALRACAVWGNKTADVVALVSYSLNGRVDVGDLEAASTSLRHVRIVGQVQQNRLVDLINQNKLRFCIGTCL